MAEPRIKPALESAEFTAEATPSVRARARTQSALREPNELGAGQEGSNHG
jgi:hypothetical protein